MVSHLPVPLVRFFILRRSSHLGQRLMVGVSRKMIITQQTLRRTLRGVRARCPSFVPIFPWVRGYTSRLLRHPRPESTPPSQPPSNRLSWTYYGLVIFQHSSYEAFMRAILQHLLFFAFLNYLNRLHFVLCQGLWATRGFHFLTSARIQLNSSSITIIFDIYIVIQFTPSAPVIQSFWSMGLFILEFASLRFLAIYLNSGEGVRYYCFITTGIALDTRSQRDAKVKKKVPFLPLTQALVRQVTDTCVITTILCILAACIFDQIGK